MEANSRFRGISVSAKDIAALVNGVVEGDEQVLVTGFAAIESAHQGDLCFLGNSKYSSYLKSTQAAVVLVSAATEIENTKACLIKVKDPSWAFSFLLARFFPVRPPFKEYCDPRAAIDPNIRFGKGCFVGPCAVIEAGASIGNDCYIGAGAYIGANVILEDGCYIYPNATIREDVICKKRVIVHSGSVIGSDGFGYIVVKGKQEKVPQIGIVILEKDVEIGANVCIDRARFEQTVIGAGTKIDNLVQIAHNVEVGQNCVIVAQSGISGSTKVGNNTIIAAQAGTVGHISIGNNVVLAARSGVTKDVPDNVRYSGFPAIEHNQEKKLMVLRNSLPKLQAKLKALEEAVDNIKKQLRA